jgi:hypothetical protein
MRHAPIPIAGQFILDALDDRNELGIAEIQSHYRRSVVERAPPKIDHFALPSDGAGRGPVTTEYFSLLPAIGWRGVF